jgi:hypothetical protein
MTTKTETKPKAKPKAKKKTTKTETVLHIPVIVRAVAVGLGSGCISLSAIGAYQMQAAIDGPTSYTAIAAATIAVSAGAMTVLAEHCYAAGHKLKAIGLVLAAIPAAVVAFYGAAERVQLSRAGSDAERVALGSTATRAEADLKEAKAAWKLATLAADKVRGLDAKACGPKCESIKASETAARKRVTEAELAVQGAQKHATKDADLKAQPWLLPVAVDLAGLIFWMVGFAPSKKTEAKKPAKKTSTKGKRNTKTNKAAKPSGAVIKLHAVG